jgi:hypothetical protein
MKIYGGLGNQMFQYALGRHISLKNNTNLKLDIGVYKKEKLHNFELEKLCCSYEIATSEESSSLIYRDQCVLERLIRRLAGRAGVRYRDTRFFEQETVFQPAILDIAGDAYLDGYWQCEKYFIEVADTIRDDFKLKSTLSDKSIQMLQKIKSVESVSLHVRRGDYVNNQNTNDVHGVCELEYYKNAVDILLSRIAKPLHIFVFSDDIDWAGKNISFECPMTIVDHNDAGNACQDLHLMSNCRHHIIANSSFSWWGAWLNSYSGKQVIAPKRWFKSEEWNFPDLIPGNWQQI